MNKLARVEDKKNFVAKLFYNIRYSNKFKKLNIDKSFSETLIDRRKDSAEKEIFYIIRKSKNKNDFANRINRYLKSQNKNIYANTLLIGNITGKYVFGNFYYDTLKGINIDAFSKENKEMLPILRDHFYEYIINNNKRKNKFVQELKVGNNYIRDLSSDIDKKELLESYDKILDGEYSIEQSEEVFDYLVKTIGTYTKDDITDNFDFVLDDINKSHTKSLDERRKEYQSYNKLSNNQIKKIEETDILRKKLQEINGKKSTDLLERLNKLGNNLIEKIDELEDIYLEYEVLLREELIDNLYVPQNDITIIEDYKEMKPQLLHQFIRNPQQFKDMELEKIKEKIISERTDKNESKELTQEEQQKFEKMKYGLEVKLDPYKVNYTTDGKGTKYTDSQNMNEYHSDTTNQISASIFQGKEFIYSRCFGIRGIGFNKETLCPEAIGLTSNNYLTTNKGINNLEYNERYEFEVMSAPFSELIKANGDSEIIMHRRGMDFDTKASYIFATIDSSDLKSTDIIMKEIEEIRKKEGLKVVIYDLHKIRKTYEQDIKKEDKESTR